MPSIATIPNQRRIFLLQTQTTTEIHNQSKVQKSDCGVPAWYLQHDKTPTPKAQETFLEQGQRDVKSQRTRTSATGWHLLYLTGKLRLCNPNTVA